MLEQIKQAIIAGDMKAINLAIELMGTVKIVNLTYEQVATIVQILKK